MQPAPAVSPAPPHQAGPGLAAHPARTGSADLDPAVRTDHHHQARALPRLTVNVFILISVPRDRRTKRPAVSELPRTGGTRDPAAGIESCPVHLWSGAVGR